METEQLEGTIARAVAGLDGPDDARLATILEHLKQIPAPRLATRRTIWPWLLLSVATVAAATTGYWYTWHTGLPTQLAIDGSGTKKTTAQVPASPEHAVPDSPSKSEQGGAPPQNTTIIYRHQD